MGMTFDQTGNYSVIRSINKGAWGTGAAGRAYALDNSIADDNINIFLLTITNTAE